MTSSVRVAICTAVQINPRALTSFLGILQICPGLTANEIQIPYDKHHKVSSLVKGHQNTHNSVKYEVI